MLDLSVTGLGPISLPMTSARAKQLRELAAPAKYGKGTDLSLPPSCTLRPELHSMLVYERGQPDRARARFRQQSGTEATLGRAMIVARQARKSEATARGQSSP